MGALGNRAQAVLAGGLGQVKQHQPPSLLLPPEALDPRQAGRVTKDETEKFRNKQCCVCQSVKMSLLPHSHFFWSQGMAV